MNEILDPNNTLKWSPTVRLRMVSDRGMQQLYTSMTNSGEPLSEWRYVDIVHLHGPLDTNIE